MGCLTLSFEFLSAVSQTDLSVDAIQNVISSWPILAVLLGFIAVGIIKKLIKMVAFAAICAAIYFVYVQVA